MPIDFPTRLDLFAVGRDHVLSRAKKIDPNQVNVVGSDVNIIVASSSFMAFETVKQCAQKVSALLLGSAMEDDLDRWVWDRYTQARKGSSAALVVVRFFRDAAGNPGSVPVGTLLATLDGIEYITTTPAGFGTGDLESTAYARSVLAGTLVKAGKNTIRRISQPALLFDTTLQVTNDDTSGGGEDREDDSIFRERMRGFWLTVRRGTLAAIEMGAVSTDGVVSAQAVEALTPENLPARVMMLYIADSSGISSLPLAESVRQNLEDWRAGGIAVLVSTSTPQLVDVRLKLTFKANSDSTNLTVYVKAAIVEYVNSLSVNQTLLKSDLVNVLRRFASYGLIVNDQTIIAPAGDLVPDAGRTLRMTNANLTVI